MNDSYIAYLLKTIGDIQKENEELRELLREGCKQQEKFKYFCQLIQGERSERFLSEVKNFLNRPEVKALLNKEKGE